MGEEKGAKFIKSPSVSGTRGSKGLHDEPSALFAT
jgi:hypothetical protein